MINHAQSNYLTSKTVYTVFLKILPSNFLVFSIVEAFLRTEV